MDKKKRLILCSTVFLLLLTTGYAQQSAPDTSTRKPSQGLQIGGWDGTQFNFAKVDSSGNISTSGGGGGSSSITVFQGAAHEANSQVTASTSAATLIAARATRRSCLIKNTDATITVYIGAATVTAGNGMPLKAGESVSISAVTLVQVIAASGSPVVAVFDEYD